MKDRPIPGKVYALTGAFGEPSIASGNTWAESEVKVCGECGERHSGDCGPDPDGTYPCDEGHYGCARTLRGPCTDRTRSRGTVLSMWCNARLGLKHAPCDVPRCECRCHPPDYTMDPRD